MLSQVSNHCMNTMRLLWIANREHPPKADSKACFLSTEEGRAAAERALCRGGAASTAAAA